MDIVLYPDPRLRAENAPVEDFDEDLAAVAREMFGAMYRTRGVGLAAPQVGINRRLLVYNPTGEAENRDAEVVLVNPRVVRRSKDKEFGQEGCLSFPEIYAQVERPVRCTLEAQNLQGERFEMELEEWEARIFQHELDHLDGVLFIDRMSPAEKGLIKGRLEELVRSYKQAVAES